MRLASLLAVLLLAGVASTALIQLRSANRARDLLQSHARQGPHLPPPPPVVEVLSPAFVATMTGPRYHLGCIIDEHSFVYGIWTTRSHTVVRVFEPNEAGWREAWDVHRVLESDPTPAWLDHRGAPRSRREWSHHAATAPASLVSRAAPPERAREVSGSP